MEMNNSNIDNDNNEDFSSNQDEIIECDNNLDNNQQNLDEGKDESKKSEERLLQMKSTKLGEQEPFQHLLVGDPPFPVGALEALDQMVNRKRWVVPVIPKGDLEQLLHAAINLCREGVFG